MILLPPLIALTFTTALNSNIFPKYDTPILDKADWSTQDKELKQRLHHLHYYLGRATNKEDISMLGDLISKEIEKFVSEKPELFEKVEVKSGAAFVKHTSKTMAQLKTHKKALQRQMIGPEGTIDIRKQFWEACRAISDLKKQEKKVEDLKTTACQEKLYNKNRWEFSKMTVNGQMGKECLSPTFSKQAADLHYSGTYSTEKTTDFNQTRCQNQS